MLPEIEILQRILQLITTKCHYRYPSPAVKDANNAAAENNYTKR